MLESPRYWLSKQSESRKDAFFDRRASGAAAAAAGKNLEPDFWLVTERDSRATFDDLESNNSGLVLQMQPRPPMPGMPTPTRPPRTASTLQAGKALSAITSYTYSTTAATAVEEDDRDQRSVASAASAKPPPLKVVKPSPRASTASTSIAAAPTPARPLDLNKPLPRIGTAVLDDSFASERELSAPAARQQRQHMSSVYQFIPYEDGHISVHKARKSAFRTSNG
jgi:hypothetical protein